MHKTFRCGHPKSYTNTYHNNATTGCRICRYAAVKRWIKRNPGYTSEANTLRRKRSVAARMKEQHRRCAICGRIMKHPYRDHNHACCSINKRGGCPKCRRGLLCPSCNGGLHLIESKRLHKAAIKYLEKWETQWNKKNT